MYNHFFFISSQNELISTVNDEGKTVMLFTKHFYELNTKFYGLYDKINNLKTSIVELINRLGIFTLTK